MRRSRFKTSKKPLKKKRASPPGSKKKKKEKKVKGRNHFYNGYKMASHSEVLFAQRCTSEGILWDYECDVLKWTPPEAKYIPDFKIECEDGSYFYVEYKGYLRPQDKKKMMYVKKQNPDVDIRFVFEDASKPVSGARARKDGSKMTHAEWASIHGYQWAEKFIPAKWLKGE